jgi:hypothetical protein
MLTQLHDFLILAVVPILASVILLAWLVGIGVWVARRAVGLFRPH